MDKIRPYIGKNIIKILVGQPIKGAWLFGSCSRGEETSGSDIDILVDYDNSNDLVSLFRMGGILMDLSDLLGCKVDLVENRGLKDFARKSVEKDKILMKDPIKDPGRISHMLEMAKLIESEKSRHTYQGLCSDKILFYGLSKMVEL